MPEFWLAGGEGNTAVCLAFRKLRGSRFLLIGFVVKDRDYLKQPTQNNRQSGWEPKVSAVNTEGKGRKTCLSGDNVFDVLKIKQ